MTFFNEKKLQPRRIEIDTNGISSESPQVRQRLDRIHENYQQLESILAEVEAKIRNDERLSAIDQSIKEVEIIRKKKEVAIAERKEVDKSEEATVISG